MIPFYLTVHFTGYSLILTDTFHLLKYYYIPALESPYLDYVLINKELEEFNKKLLTKPMVIIANKMDIEGSIDNLAKFKEKVKDKKIFEISAIQAMVLLK